MFFDVYKFHKVITQPKINATFYSFYDVCKLKIDMSNDMEEDDPQISEIKKWCKKNCKGRCMLDFDVVFKFQFEEDALAFKLRWM